MEIGDYSHIYYIFGIQWGIGEWKYYGNNMSWFGGVLWNKITQFYPKCESSPIIEIKKKEYVQMA